MTPSRIARLIAVAIGLVAVYAIVLYAAEVQLTRMLPRAIAETIGGRDADGYTVQVDNLSFSPFLTGISVHDLTISFDSAAARTVSEPAIIRTASLGSLELKGLSLTSLLLGNAIVASSVDIDRPRIEIELSADPGKQSPASTTDGNEASARTTGEPFALGLAFDRIHLRGGSIDLTRWTDRGMLTSYLRGADLELTEIKLDTISFANPVRALANSSVTITIDSLSHTSDDNLYVIAARNVLADSRDSLFAIDAVRVIPTLEPNQFFDRLTARSDRIQMSAGPIRIEGIDFANYVRSDSIHARLVDVDSLDLHVNSNIGLAWARGTTPCQYHNGFADIPFPLRINEIRVNDGSILYSELAKGSDRPGDLTLEAVNGTITNLTNEPGRMTHATPAVVNVTAKLFGESDMQATLAYPLLSETLDFGFEVSAGPMNLTHANKFLTNVAGLEIKSGQLDSLWASAEVQNGEASGQLDILYQDLDFRLVDKNSRKEMAWHAVAGWVGGVVVRSDNPKNPGDEPRGGRIDYTCGNKDVVFFEFFVHILANGLKRVVI